MKMVIKITGRVDDDINTKGYRLGSVAFSTDNRRIASGSFDCHIKLWPMYTYN